jgi:nucleoside-diphosphate-sugar epimerase
LLHRGWHVTALVRPESDLWRIADESGAVNILRADLAQLDRAADAIRGVKPDVMFHLAWQGVDADSRNDPAPVATNVTGSIGLIRLAQESGCRAWIGVGSQAEYGPYKVPLKEDLPTHPVTTYGVSKLCVGMFAERLCASSGLRFVWLRLLAIYGPKDDERHVIPMVIQRLLRKRKPSLTAGEQICDYLYVEDAADALCATAANATVQGVFNLSYGKGYRLREIIEIIRDRIDPSLPLGLGEVPYRPDQIMHIQADISKLQRATDWSPKISLAEGIARTVEWYRHADDRA